MAMTRIFNIKVGFAAISLMFSVFQHHLMILNMGQQYVASVEAAKGVVTGYPFWRVFQNRILGPYLVEWIAGYTSDQLLAHFIFTIVTIAIAGYLAWYLGYKMKNAATGLFAFFVFQCSFSMVADKYWFYAWDPLDLIIFFLFALFIVSGKSWKWFVALFAVALLNRESCQFIAFWLIADPLVRKASAAIRKVPEQLDWKTLAAGIACAVTSIVVIEMLRRGLMIEEVGFKIWNKPRNIEFGPNFQLKIWLNLRDIAKAFTTLQYELHMASTLQFISFGAIALTAAIRLRGKYISLAVLQFAMLTGIFLVGAMIETRVYFQMLPLLVLSVTALAIQMDAKSPAPGHQ
jgi:hypothetical protein